MLSQEPQEDEIIDLDESLKSDSITGQRAPFKKLYSEEYKRELIAKVDAKLVDGMSVEDAITAAKVDRNRYYRWRRELGLLRPKKAKGKRTFRTTEEKLNLVQQVDDYAEQGFTKTEAYELAGITQNQYSMWSRGKALRHNGRNTIGEKPKPRLETIVLEEDELDLEPESHAEVPPEPPKPVVTATPEPVKVPEEEEGGDIIMLVGKGKDIFKALEQMRSKK